jgi:hypothetical protein
MTTIGDLVIDASHFAREGAARASSNRCHDRRSAEADIMLSAPHEVRADGIFCCPHCPIPRDESRPFKPLGWIYSRPGVVRVPATAGLQTRVAGRQAGGGAAAVHQQQLPALRAHVGGESCDAGPGTEAAVHEATRA